MVASESDGNWTAQAVALPADGSGSFGPLDALGCAQSACAALGGDWLEPSGWTPMVAQAALQSAGSP